MLPGVASRTNIVLSSTVSNSFLLVSDNCKLKLNIKIQRVQNKGLKLALNKEMRYDTGILHKEARLASWEVRARLALMCLMFKYKSDESCLLTRSLGSYTRSFDGPTFIQSRPSTDWYRRSISYISRKEWNALPVYIRCISETRKFKKELKLLYYHRYFQSIDDL